MTGSVQVPGVGAYTIADHPDRCPICKSIVSPIYATAKLFGKSYKADLEVIYQCPNQKCQEFFIAYFTKALSAPGVSNHYRLTSLKPSEISDVTISKELLEISQSFCQIYNEAHKAYTLGLKLICGVGYRKSLEFLIKDYVISKNPEKSEHIKASYLGTCIENYISDPRIKELSKRATWLGNDETHYTRLWVDKDLEDLRKVIEVVLHWIQMEILTEKTLKDMLPKK